MKQTQQCVCERLVGVSETSEPPRTASSSHSASCRLSLLVFRKERGSRFDVPGLFEP